MEGYGGQILKVDLTSGKITKEMLSEEMIRNYLGGEGFAVKLVYDNIKPGKDAFDPSNVLAMAGGLFNGLPVPTGGKTAFCSKSPLTNTIAESIMGGPSGVELKRAGYDALMIQGKAPFLSYLMINDDKVEIKDGRDLQGKSARETTDLLQKKEGKVKVASIGVGGENLVRYACIDCEDRQAGRGGLGAVMGSKNLKAIAIHGTKDIMVKDPKRLMELALKWHEVMVKSPGYVEDTKYGTGEFLNWINEERGVFPTRNWQESVFEKRKEIDPYYWAPKYSKKNKACYGCTKPCGKLFVIEEGKYAGTVLDGVEYEGQYSLGGQCGNGDIESVAKAYELCDIYGLDVISAGVVIGFAMELFERGILTRKDVDGLDLRFGNGEAEIEMVKKIAKREGIGNVLAEGVKRAAEKIGKGSEYYAIHVKGLEPPAYDVRGIKGMALAFMTSPRGACHLRSCAYALELTGKFWKFEGVDRFSSEKKGYEIKEMEDLMTLYDILGVCKFSRSYFLAEGFLDIIEAITGRKLTEKELLRIGERVNNLKRLFNLREGLSREDDALPKRITTEPIPGGAAKGHYVKPGEMNHMLEDYYRERGWDSNGNPTKDKLRELELT